MTLRPEKTNKPGKRKAARKRPTGYDISLDYSATYVRTSDGEQVYFDKDSGRYYLSGGYYDDRYTLINKRDEGEITRTVRPESWNRRRIGKKSEDNGRIVYKKDGKDISTPVDGKISLWDEKTRGYIMVPLDKATGIERVVRWPEGYSWGSKDGRVLVEKGWWSGGEGSSHETGKIYVDGEVVERFNPIGLGRNIDMGRVITRASEIANELEE